MHLILLFGFIHFLIVGFISYVMCYMIRVSCVQLLMSAKYSNNCLVSCIKEYMSDSFTNYNYVGNTKVSVSIKKNLCQQMHIKRDISY